VDAVPLSPDSDREFEVSAEAALEFAFEEVGVQADGDSSEIEIPILAKKLILWRQGHRISRSAMDDLLKLLHLHAAQVPLLPLTESAFSRAQRALIPNLRLTEIEMPEGTVCIL
jgi:hypothetical protein